MNRVVNVVDLMKLQSHSFRSSSRSTRIRRQSTSRNELDRYHVVMDAFDRMPKLGARGVYLKELLLEQLIEHKRYICRYGQDLPEIRNWTWGATKDPS